MMDFGAKMIGALTLALALITGFSSEKAGAQISFTAENNVYRYYNNANGTHFYTLNSTEGMHSGFSLEGVAFNAFSDPSVPGTVPVFRCRLGAYWHFISRDPACEGQASERALGWIYSPFRQAPQGSIPLYRAWNPNSGEHLVTTNAVEVWANGFRWESTLGYVMAQYDVYRFVGHGSHFFTTSASEALNSGFAVEGVSFRTFANFFPGSLPVYGCLAGTSHFLSNRVTCEGSRNVGFVGYVFAEWTAAGQTPLYRSYNGSTGDFLQTTSWAEANSGGFTYQGPIGFVPVVNNPNPNPIFNIFSSFSIGTNEVVSAGNVSFLLRTDGNLLLLSEFNTANEAIAWQTASAGRDCTSGCSATLSPDGNLYLVQNGNIYWSSNTSGSGPSQIMVTQHSPYVFLMQQGRAVYPYITAGHSMNFSNGGFQFVFRTDGNLVAYVGSANSPSLTPDWSSQTYGRSCEWGCRAVFQPDASITLQQNGFAYWNDSFPILSNGAVFGYLLAIPQLTSVTHSAACGQHSSKSWCN